jgi:hypothetical protein
MTSPDFHRLIAEIDDADKDLERQREHERKCEAAFLDAQHSRQLAEANAAALHRALVLVGGKEPDAAPAEKPKPEKEPRFLCADMIKQIYGDGPIPEGAQLDKSITDRWNWRTINAAITIVKDRRAVAVAAEPDDPDLDIPQALDRRNAHG